MNDQEMAQLKAYVVYINEYYQRPALSDMVIKMYASDLSDLSFEQVINAFEKYRKNPRNKTAPLPSAIRAIINPEIDDDTYAISTASKVLEAVSKFGWSRQSEARAYIGELGWVSVSRFGDWTYVCENLGTSKLALASFQAQVRDIAKSEIKVLKAGGQLPQIESFRQEQIDGPQNVVQLLDLKIKEVK